MRILLLKRNKNNKNQLADREKKLLSSLQLSSTEHVEASLTMSSDPFQNGCSTEFAPPLTVNDKDDEEVVIPSHRPLPRMTRGARRVMKKLKKRLHQKVSTNFFQLTTEATESVITTAPPANEESTDTVTQNAALTGTTIWAKKELELRELQNQKSKLLLLYGPYLTSVDAASCTNLSPQEFQRKARQAQKEVVALDAKLETVTKEYHFLLFQHQPYLFAAQATDSPIPPMQRALAQDEASFLLDEYLDAPAPRDVQPPFKIGPYRFLPECLGSGSFGSVWKAEASNKTKRKSATVHAIKIIPKSRMKDWLSFQDMNQELTVLQQHTDHPNLLTYHETLHGPTNLYVVTELAHTSVWRYAAICSFQDVGQIVLGALRGLHHLHKAGWAHLDVKSENILLVRDNRQNGDHIMASHVRLCDFGFCHQTTAGDDETVPVLGSFGFTAPEIMFETARQNSLLARADVWSIGATIVELLWGHLSEDWMKSGYRGMGPERYSHFGGNCGQIDPVKSFTKTIHRHLEEQVLSIKTHQQAAQERQHRESELQGEELAWYEMVRDIMLVATPKQRWTASACLEHPLIQQAVQYERKVATGET